MTASTAPPAEVTPRARIAAKQDATFTGANPAWMETQAAIDRYLASPALSDSTRRAYGVDLAEFGAWLRARKASVDDVDARLLADYAAELGAARRGRDPSKLAPATIARKLAAVRAFLRFTLGASKVPDARLSPRRPRRLPEAPKQAEIEAELERFASGDPLAIRNRALAELVYSAGLRSQEAVDLDLADVEFDQEALRVRGKGGKERVVPLGEEAAYWVALLAPRAPEARARRPRRALHLGARTAARHEHAPQALPASAPPATRLRDAPAGGRRRPADDPGAPRPQLPVDHADVQPRRREAAPKGV